MTAGALYLALVHGPVVLGDGRVGTAALTTLDVHDLARVGRTYAARRVFVVTDVPAHQALAHELRTHFTTGAGAATAPDRAEALSILDIQPTLADVLAVVGAEHGERPRLALTAARPLTPPLAAADARAHLAAGRPLCLVFGTAHGLHGPSLAPLCASGDGYLPPIQPGGYNHLSVRAAIAIATDRLVGSPW